MTLTPVFRRVALVACHVRHPAPRPAPAGTRGGCAVVLLALALSAPGWAQLRVVTWNITNYYGGRTADIQTAVYGVFEGRSMSPDVILGQEFMSQTAINDFKSALNSASGSPGDWLAAPFINGADAALFYRSSKISYLGYIIASQGGAYPNPPRHGIRYNTRLANYTANKAVLCLYNSHFKAAESGGQDEERRLTEAQRIRDNAETLNTEWNFLLGADLNIYDASELAYQELTNNQANNNGRFFDPIASPGGWNSESWFKFIHSQDPVGPMDDRFDQLLISDNLFDGDALEYIGNPSVPFSTATWNDPNHSYRTYGNDGTSFEQALKTTGNTMVGAAIAQAIKNLAMTGGHIPVYLDLRVPPEIGSDTLLNFGQVPQNAVAEQTLNVWNDGNVALWTAAGIGDLNYTLAASTGFAAPPGTFTDPADGSGNLHVITMDTSTPGPLSGTTTIASNAPDEPLRVVTLVGEVLPGGLTGDLDCDGDVDFDDINPFVLALTGYEAYHAVYPDCDWLNGDCNDDGTVDFDDINCFVALLSQ